MASTWHMNSDRPLYTRHPEPSGWGSAVTSTWQPMDGLSDQQKGLSIAAHEAGHVVMFLAAGIAVGGVEISKLEITDGQEVMATTSMGEYAARWGDIAIGLAAGERAHDYWLRQEGLWTPERAWSIERHAREDREHLAEVTGLHVHRRLTFGVDSSSDFDYQRVCDLADRAVAENWGRIQRLAHALAERRKLDGGQILAVLEAS